MNTPEHARKFLFRVVANHVSAFLHSGICDRPRRKANDKGTLFFVNNEPSAVNKSEKRAGYAASVSTSWNFMLSS